MYRFYKLFFLLFLFNQPFSARAQVFEIRIAAKGVATFAVQMRAITGRIPTPDDYVTDIVFGIRWRDTTNIDLPNAMSTDYNIKKAGTRSHKNNYYFQAFYSEPVGFTIPSPWAQNQWIDILTINNLPGTGMATFEICTPGFDITTQPNFALNFVDFTPMINGSSAVVLPVRYSGFEAIARKEFIQLLWNTSMEMNTKHFRVERSLNGNRFESIFQVTAAGNSTTEKKYEHKDAQAVNDYKGKVVFYRIAQVDNDGAMNYSVTRKVLIPNGRNTLRLVQNPVNLEAILLYDCLQNDKIVLRVTDAGGKTVYKKEISVVIGNNQFIISASGFANGAYTINLIGNHDHQSITMTKL